MGVLVKTTSAVCDHFRISLRTFYEWRKKGCPGKSGGFYDLAKIQAWQDQRDGKVGGSPPDSRQGFLTLQRGKDYEDARLKRNRADLAEMDLKIRRKELLGAAEVNLRLDREVLTVKAGMKLLQRVLPPLLHGLDERSMSQVIAERTDDLLNLFAHNVQQIKSPQIRITKSEFLSYAAEYYDLAYGGERESG